MRRTLVLGWALWAGLCAAAQAQAAEPPDVRTWRFEARLDEVPIGEHRFELQGRDGAPQVLHSDASFVVRLLGIPVYRYRHRATEHWRDGCLQSLVADTDDNGRQQAVRATRAADRLQVQAPGGDTLLEGCVLSFAYWHPALRQQAQLLNPQTGALEPVRMQRMDDAPLPVRGRPVAAQRWRILAPGQTIDLWLAAADGAWIGLDALLDGGHRLSYRLP